MKKYINTLLFFVFFTTFNCFAEQCKIYIQNSGSFIKYSGAYIEYKYKTPSGATETNKKGYTVFNAVSPHQVLWLLPGQKAPLILPETEGNKTWIKKVVLKGKGLNGKTQWINAELDLGDYTEIENNKMDFVVTDNVMASLKKK